MLPKICTHAIRGFRRIFLVTMSSSRPVGRSLRVQNIALDSEVLPESSRKNKYEYDRFEFLSSWNQRNDTSNDAN
jgi:hypothetical protein